jgi:hypothetical protein
MFHGKQYAIFLSINHERKAAAHHTRIKPRARMRVYFFLLFDYFFFFLYRLPKSELIKIYRLFTNTKLFVYFYYEFAVYRTKRKRTRETITGGGSLKFGPFKAL